jgi:hypothetical protein
MRNQPGATAYPMRPRLPAQPKKLHIPTPPDTPDTRVLRPDDDIQRNGQEYLVTINGSVFLALTLAEAEAIVKRMRNRPGDAIRDGAAAPPQRSAVTQEKNRKT